MEPIHVTDADDPRVADYGGLRDPEHRIRLESNEFFVIEGITAISRLMTSRFRVRSLFVTPRNFQRLESSLEHAICPVYVADKALMTTVAGYEIHRGAIAAADRGDALDLVTVLQRSRTVAVLEGLNDHENLGAIARSARALGIDALLLDQRCADPFYRRSVRVSMGEILHIDIVRMAQWPGDLRVLTELGYRLLSLTPNSRATPLSSVTRTAFDRVALLLGAEGPGLSAETLALTELVQIPIRDDVDSLNVGHAAAIAFAQIGLV